MGRLGLSGYCRHPEKKAKSAININRCSFVCFITAKKRFFSRFRITFTRKYYICQQNNLPWRSNWDGFPACWCLLYCSPLVHHRNRELCARRNDKWRKWRSNRRRIMTEPNRHTTRNRRRRPNGWFKKTNAMLSGWDGDNGATRFFRLEKIEIWYFVWKITFEVEKKLIEAYFYKLLKIKIINDWETKQEEKNVQKSIFFLRTFK